MSRRFFFCLFASIALLIPIQALHSQPVVEDSVLSLIEAQTMDSSDVMEIARMMTDVYGPRLTGSPQLDRAEAWALDQLAKWGIKDAHLDDWGPFGRGWTLQRYSLHVTSPSVFLVDSYPKAWTSSTDGPETGEFTIVDIKNEEDFAKYHGKLKGKFVLLAQPRDIEPLFDPIARRKSDEDLLKLANAPQPAPFAYHWSAERIARYRFEQKVFNFVYNENPAAIFDNGWRGELGTIFVAQASVPAEFTASWRDRKAAWNSDVKYVLPQVTINGEDYNRLYRMVSHGLTVKAELNLQTKFNDEDPMEYNVIAEIPGTDPKIGDQVVMIGGHYDSWHSGTGATDNGAGSAVMMEVMRTLKHVYAELGRGPRRTIRMALWTGEEEGLLGSTAYVAEHVAVPREAGEPPLSMGPDYNKISAYYNLDNGSGKIRGIFLQGNEQLRPMFRQWFAPFKNMGASTVTVANTTGTDHLSFDAVGVPGFQFIQDDLEYGTTHHSNVDVYDHLSEDDLKQAATIIAAFVYNTSERNEMIPRKTLSMNPEHSASH